MDTKQTLLDKKLNLIKAKHYELVNNKNMTLIRIDRIKLDMERLQKRHDFEMREMADYLSLTEKRLEHNIKEIESIEKVLGNEKAVRCVGCGQYFLNISAHKCAQANKIKADLARITAIEEEAEELNRRERKKAEKEEKRLIEAQRIKEAAVAAEQERRRVEAERERLQAEEKRLVEEINKRDQEKLEEAIRVREEQKRLQALEDARKREAETERIAQEKAAEVAKAIDNHIDAGLKVDELEGKVKCPECDNYFTRGGAYAKHYGSHFKDNGDGDA